MKYFNKLAEETPKDLNVKKSPVWIHEAGTKRSDDIKKDFKGMAFTAPNSPMVSDTTTTTFTGDGSNPYFKKDHKYEQQNISHLSYNEDGVSGVNKSDMYVTDPSGKRTFTSSDSSGSGSKSDAISKDKAVKNIQSKEESRGLKRDKLSTDLTKGSSLKKTAAGPLAVIPLLAKILGGTALRVGAGTAARVAAGTAARTAAGTGTKALATTATGTGGAGSAAASGGFWSNLFKPTWGKAGMIGMMIPWGGKGAKGTEAVGNYGKMSKMPTGDMSFWEGAKNW